jgi:hypothetical protein
MDIGAIVSRARKAAADNTPTILTAIGVTGTIATAVLARKASFKAAEVLSERREADKKLINEGQVPLEEIDELSSKKVEIGLVWKYYIPAVVTGGVTVACIVTANRVSNRRAAALATAYSVSQEAFREYKGKVFEKIGEKKEQAIRDEITQDRVNANPPGPIVLVGDDVLCRDAHSGRYFKSNKNEIDAAVNEINWQLINDDYASLTDFWEKIGLSQTADSDEVGWNMQGGKFEVQLSGALSEDGRPVLEIQFLTSPIRSYYKNHR